MRSLKKLLLLLAGVTLVSQVQAAGILELADEADVIVLGKTVEVPNNSAETVKLSITPEAVLKGSAGNLPLQLVFLKLGASRVANLAPRACVWCWRSSPLLAKYGACLAQPKSGLSPAYAIPNRSCDVVRGQQLCARSGLKD